MLDFIVIWKVEGNDRSIKRVFHIHVYIASSYGSWFLKNHQNKKRACMISKMAGIQTDHHGELDLNDSTVPVHYALLTKNEMKNIDLITLVK